MVNKATIGIGLLCLLLSLPTYTQQLTYRDYQTQYYYDSGFAGSNPSYTVQEVEQHYNHFKANPDVIPINIHVIFHVIHQNSNQQLSQQTIEAAISQLNAHFGVNTYDSYHVSDPRNRYEKTFCSNTKIRFCLVSQDFLSSAESTANPINYVQTNKAVWDVNNEMKFASTNGSDAVLTDYLLNVWVCNLKGNTIAGFAQRPGGAALTDGVVIDWQYMFGHQNVIPDYNEGATLTHLVGNFLNLHDLWQPNCDDDKVFDTPIHNAPNFGCPEYAHVTLCHNDLVQEMSMNFMDNTNDDCQYMFTNGQQVRMHSAVAFDGPRSGLRIPGECGPIRMRSIDEVIPDDFAISDLEEDNIKVYPNPATNGFWVRSGEINGTAKLSLLAVDGRLILERDYNSIIEDYIDLDSEILPGMYILEIKGNAISHIQQITIQ